MLLCLTLLATPFKGQSLWAGGFRGEGIPKGEPCESSLKRTVRLVGAQVRLVGANKKMVSGFVAAALYSMWYGGSTASEALENRHNRNQSIEQVAQTADQPLPQELDSIVDTLMGSRIPYFIPRTLEGAFYNRASNHSSLHQSAVEYAFVHRSDIGIRGGLTQAYSSNTDNYIRNNRILQLGRQLTSAQTKALLKMIFADQSSAYIYQRRHLLNARPHIFDNTNGDEANKNASELTLAQLIERTSVVKRNMGAMLAFAFVLTHPDVSINDLLEIESLCGIQRIDLDGLEASSPFTLRLLRVLSVEAAGNLRAHDVAALLDGVLNGQNAQEGNITEDHPLYWNHAIIREYLRAQTGGQSQSLENQAQRIEDNLQLTTRSQFHAVSREEIPLWYTTRLLNTPDLKLERRSVISIYRYLVNYQRSLESAGNTFRSSTPDQIAELKASAASLIVQVWENYFSNLNSQRRPLHLGDATAEQTAAYFTNLSQIQSVEWWQNHLNALVNANAELPQFLQPALAYAVNREIRTMTISKLAGVLASLPLEIRRDLLINFFTIHRGDAPSVQNGQLARFIAGFDSQSTRLPLAEALLETGKIRTVDQAIELAQLEGVGAPFLIYLVGQHSQMIRSRKDVTTLTNNLTYYGSAAMTPLLNQLTRQWQQPGFHRFFPMAREAIGRLMDNNNRENTEISNFLVAARPGMTRSERRQLANLLSRSADAYYSILFRP